MIELNGSKFAANKEEFISSLFKSGGTCSGFYKPMKNRIRLFNPQMIEVGSITCYAVLAKCDILKDSKKWYSYGEIKEVGKCEDFAQQNREMNNLLSQFNIQRKY